MARFPKGPLLWLTLLDMDAGEIMTDIERTSPNSHVLWTALQDAREKAEFAPS